MPLPWQSRAQARVHIQELTTELTECKGKLEYAMDTMVKERNAKNEYRLKQEAYTNKVASCLPPPPCCHYSYAQ